jgi:hypothetical protein
LTKYFIVSILRTQKKVLCIDPAPTSPLTLNPSPFSVLPYIPLKLSNHSIHRNVGNDNDVIASTSEKCFTLANIQHIGLEKNRTLGRMLEALSTASPTIYGTSFRGLSIAQRIILSLVLRAGFV